MDCFLQQCRLFSAILTGPLIWGYYPYTLSGIRSWVWLEPIHPELCRFQTNYSLFLQSPASCCLLCSSGLIGLLCFLVTAPPSGSCWTYTLQSKYLCLSQTLCLASFASVCLVSCA
ncbi:hypothetical protein FKM82_003672 [Ascaphus truei]